MNESKQEWIGGILLTMIAVLFLVGVWVVASSQPVSADRQPHRYVFPEDGVVCYTKWTHHNANLECVQIDGN